jgi:hypothetical protein
MATTAKEPRELWLGERGAGGETSTEILCVVRNDDIGREEESGGRGKTTTEILHDVQNDDLEGSRNLVGPGRRFRLCERK